MSLVAKAKIPGVEATAWVHNALSSPTLTATRDPFSGLTLEGAGVAVKTRTPVSVGARPNFTVRMPFGEGQIPRTG
jgi:hypothetical protein